VFSGALDGTIISCDITGDQSKPDLFVDIKIDDV